MPSLIADLLDRLDTERRYEFEERAGTIEFDSKVPRDEAEALALLDLLRSHPGLHASGTPPCEHASPYARNSQLRASFGEAKSQRASARGCDVA